MRSTSECAGGRGVLMEGERRNRETEPAAIVVAVMMAVMSNLLAAKAAETPFGPLFGMICRSIRNIRSIAREVYWQNVELNPTDLGSKKQRRQYQRYRANCRPKVGGESPVVALTPLQREGKKKGSPWLLALSRQ